MNILNEIKRLKEDAISFHGLVLLNLIIVIYMSVIPALTQLRAAREGAYDFFETLTVVPIAPEIRIYLSIGIYLLICASIYIKKTSYDMNDKAFIWFSIYEIVLVTILMLVLDMCYNGIIFLLMAEYLSYAGIRNRGLGFLFTSFFIYLICNYNLMTIVYPFNSFNLWAAYYPKATEALILGLKSSFEILNIMFFVIYLVILIFRDKREKMQIRELNNKLKDANEQLREYAVEKEQMGEMKERNRLAREIHDTIGHILTGISVGVEAVQVLMDIAPDAAKEQLTTIGEMSKNGLNDVRRSVHKLKPDTMEMKSLDHAIYQMVEETSKTTGAKIYFVSYGIGLKYGADEEETIFRLVQEGTTNSLRHGKASEIWIRLDKTEDGVSISLNDNGEGCATVKEGFGLTHMRERVEMLGGNISFSGENGFAIRANIPIRQGNEIKGEVYEDKGNNR